MSRVMSEGCRIVVVDDQASCDISDETVILHLRNGKYYGLNQVGSHVWRLIQESRTIDEILDNLLAEYDVDAKQCKEDLIALLQDLQAEGLIEVSGGESP